MWKRLAVVLLLVPSVVWAQASPSPNPITGFAILQNGATAVGAGINMDVTKIAVVIFQVSGTFSGSIVFEGSLDGTVWNGMECYDVTGTLVASSTVSVAGVTRCNTNALLLVRSRIATRTSGAITVKAGATSTPLVRRIQGGGGGGTGTVTSITGLAPIVATPNPITTTGTIGVNDFVASGASHARGTVPDPGAVAGTTKFLREDATWQVPGGGGVTPPGGSNQNVQFNDSGVFGGATLDWDKASNSLFPSVDPTTLGNTTIPFRTVFSGGIGASLDASSARAGLYAGDPNVVLSSDYLNLPTRGALTIIGTGFFEDIGTFRLDTNSRWDSWISNGGSFTAPGSVNVAAFPLLAITSNGWNGTIWNVKGRISNVVGPDANHGRWQILVSGDTGTGSETWFFDHPGWFTQPSVTFANLGTPGASGATIYCSNCDPTATLVACTHAGAQTGAFAFYVNGAWKCHG